MKQSLSKPTPPGRATPLRLAAFRIDDTRADSWATCVLRREICRMGHPTQSTPSLGPLIAFRGRDTRDPAADRMPGIRADSHPSERSPWRGPCVIKPGTPRITPNSPTFYGFSHRKLGRRLELGSVAQYHSGCHSVASGACPARVGGPHVAATPQLRDRGAAAGARARSRLGAIGETQQDPYHPNLGGRARGPGSVRS
jgi:hypothetical protein